MIESVAVIGTGAMGESMVGHISDGGFDVHAFDVDPDARQRAESRGATIAASPGEAARRADLSLIVVGTYDQVETVLCDDDGILSHAREGHLVAIGSTIAPEEAMALAEVATERGIEVIDVPTCRGEDAAERGDLLVLCGGSVDAVGRARPVLERFASPENVVRFGPVGTGQVAKTANNTLLWANLVADYEVLSLARQYDLDLDQLREVLERSSGDNWVLREWDWIYGKWAHKDMAITMSMADQKAVPMPLAGLVRQLVQGISGSDLDRLR